MTEVQCYDCGVEVEPEAYPEGECPVCGLTYILRDSAWDWYECPHCGKEHPSQFCANCVIWFVPEVNYD